MTIAAVANVRLPTEKAHGIQIMSMCAAFAATGEQVTLVAPKRWKNPLAVDPFSFYGMPRTFAVRQVRVLDFLHLERVLGGIAFWVERLTFAVAALFAVRRAERVWTRDEPFAALWLLVRKAPLVLEVHVPHRAFRRLYRSIARRGASLVAITHGVADELAALGVPADRIQVLPDGVDSARFAPQDRAAARRTLGLPPERRLAVYAGHLYTWKGVDTLVAASAALPVGAQVCVVGGAAADLAALRARHGEAALSRVRLVGLRPPAEIPLWLGAADVVVVPTSGTEPIGARYTSPLKVFEAMAAARPIVASDLPSLREVLRDGENAVLVAADDPAALAAGISRVLADPPLAARLAEAAARDVRAFTWARRAQAVRALLGAS